MGLLFFIVAILIFVFIANKINTLEQTSNDFNKKLTSKCPPHNWGLIIDGKFKHRDDITLEDKGFYLCSECGQRPNNESTDTKPY